MNVDSGTDKTIGIDAVFDAVPAPLFLFDRQMTIHAENDEARRAFGPNAHSRSLRLRFRAPELIALFEEALASGRAKRDRWIERGGSQRVWSVDVRRVAGSDQLFCLSFVDRSDVVAAERMRSDFIANASHELRTPLASINGFIETIRGPAKDDAGARERFLQIMADQTSRMSRLIDDLLSLSRLETRSIRERQTVEPANIVSQSVGALSKVAQSHGVVIETKIEDGLPTIVGAADELIQIVDNLIENAVKYGGSGGRLVVFAERDRYAGSEALAIGVTDFGPGIAEEHLPRLTERFYRVSVEHSRAQKGTGLGLAIVKHIVQRHDGHLSIQSALGKGSTFRVLLPFDRSEAARSADRIQRSAAASEHSSSPLQSERASMRAANS